MLLIFFINVDITIVVSAIITIPNAMTSLFNEKNMKLNFINISLDNKDLGKRLDVLLTEKYPKFSRSQFQKMILNRNIKFNKEILTNRSQKINKLGVLSIKLQPAKKINTKPENLPLKVVFEDPNLLVVDKPSGLIVHPSAGNKTHTLVNALLYHCKDTLSGIGGFERPGIVHRLDKMTSGLIIIAKNDVSHLNISQQFKSRKVKKVYQAFVWNKLKKLNDEISTKIARSTKNRLKMAIQSEKGKDALTHYKVMKEYCLNKNCCISLISLKLLTGRTHQIRVQMNYIGNSLVGDNLYKEKKTKSKKEIPSPIDKLIHKLEINGRQALHASYIEFCHPITNITMSFKSPLPNDLSELKENLNHFS